MSPVAVIETLLRVNKPAAAFLLAGLGVIAASAVAVTWIGGNQNAMSLGFYILGFAVLVTVLMFVVGNERMRAALGWILVSAFALFMIGLVDAAAQITGRMPIPACYLKILTEDPRTCQEKLGGRTTVTGPQDAVTVEPASTPSTQPIREPASSDPVTPMPGKVVLHYAPGVDADIMTRLSLLLADKGWPVEDPASGGVQVKNSPSSSQIRFYDDASRKAAFQLASLVSTTLNHPRVAVRNFSGSGLIADPGLLEIWIAP